MKKAIVSAIIAICSVLCFTTCQTLIDALEEPIVTLHSVELASINFNGAEFLCKVQVHNPNAFEIPFPEVGWQFFINANSLVDGTIKNNRRLRAKQTTIVEVPVRFEYAEAFNAITSLIGRNAANFKVALALKFNLPILGERIWNFEHEGNVPLPQVPRLTAPTFNAERIDLLGSGIDIVFSLNIQNPNSFELPAPKINFDFKVNNTSVVKSNPPANSLAPNSTTPLQTRFNISPADLAVAGISGLLTARSLSTNLTTSIDFGVPAFGKEPVTTEFPWTLPLR